MKTPGFHRMIAQSLVFPWQNFVPLGERILLEQGLQNGVLPTKLLFCHYQFSLSSARTAADRQRIIIAAYHDKNCWRAFVGFQHPWSLNDLEIQNSGILVNFSRFQAATHIWKVNFYPSYRQVAINPDDLHMKLNWCCMNTSRVSWALSLLVILSVYWISSSWYQHFLHSHNFIAPGNIFLAMPLVRAIFWERWFVM